MSVKCVIYFFSEGQSYKKSLQQQTYTKTCMRLAKPHVCLQHKPSHVSCVCSPAPGRSGAPAKESFVSFSMNFCFPHLNMTLVLESCCIYLFYPMLSLWPKPSREAEKHEKLLFLLEEPMFSMLSTSAKAATTLLVPAMTRGCQRHQDEANVLSV